MVHLIEWIHGSLYVVGWVVLTTHDKQVGVLPCLCYMRPVVFVGLILMVQVTSLYIGEAVLATIRFNQPLTSWVDKVEWVAIWVLDEGTLGGAYTYERVIGGSWLNYMPIVPGELLLELREAGLVICIIPLDAGGVPYHHEGAAAESIVYERTHEPSDEGVDADTKGR